MMLWDIIRDFFVKYIFGGTDSYGVAFAPFFGTGVDTGNDYVDILTNESFIIFDKHIFYDSSGYAFEGITIGDYLSTTATIIVMVLLCFLLVKLAIWIFKLGANLIRLR